MADQAIFDLTQEIAMTPDMRIPLQETSAATRMTSATFSLLGGLVPNTTYNTAANHADISAIAGNLYLVNISALTSDMNFTLPVAASIQTGQRIGVYITVGDDAYEMDLKSGASGDTINGTDHSSTSWSRLFITGEVVIFRCIDGATADWIVEHDGRIPCSFFAIRTTDITTSSAGWVDCAFNSVSTGPGFNIGDTYDTSATYCKIRRSGKWSFSGQHRPSNSYTSDDQVGFSIRNITQNYAYSYFFIVASTADTVPIKPVSAVFEVATGDQVKAQFYQQSADDGQDATWTSGTYSVYSYLSGAEIL